MLVFTTIARIVIVVGVCGQGDVNVVIILIVVIPTMMMRMVSSLPMLAGAGIRSIV